MISVVVVDLSAQSRKRLLEQIGSFLNASEQSLSLLPHVSIAPLSPQEVKFQEAPDVCIIGPEIVTTAPAEVAAIRKALPHAVLLASLPGQLASLSHIEQFARLGIDDVLEEQATAADFLKKLVLLKGRKRESKRGTLVLIDSGKGGLGTTSITAALGETLALSGRSCVVADGDFETHDLSRFLQVKPFINENLRLILDGQRSLSEESVSECVLPVWGTEIPLNCLPPVNESDDLYHPHAAQIRTFISVLEVLDAKYDVVFFDMGCVRGEMRKLLYRAADSIVFIVSNDPASLYASVDRISRISSTMAPDTQLVVLENACERTGLPNKLLRQEFTKAARLAPNIWSSASMPFCRQGRRWPGSGGTLASQGKSAVRAACQLLLKDIGIIAEEHRSAFSSLVKRFRTAIPAPVTAIQLDSQKPLIGLPSPAQIARIPESRQIAAPSQAVDEPERLVSGVRFRS